MKSKSITDYKKASTLNLLVGMIISFFGINKLFNKYNLELTNIGKYRLIRTIKKSNGFSNFYVGIYSDNQGNKKFIKTWQGHFRDFHYYSLLNEIISSKLLSKEFSKTAIKICGKKLEVTEVLEIIEEKRLLSVVFKYIPGKQLKCFSIPFQVTYIKGILEAFEKVSKPLQLNGFPTRSLSFMVLSLPFLIFLGVISNPKYSWTIIKSALLILKGFVLSNQKSLYLAHRDLSAENILVSKSSATIIDCEYMVLTLKDYDFTQKLIKTDSRDVYSRIQKITKEFNQPLALYISLNLSHYYDKGKQNDYLDFLIQKKVH
ncbi:hypothetical protein HYW46_03390 [Candidatus Daviesbacteria bacterium]|nr:hypothetical protein [Candidatus Daviesbacteria bacterium]